jgi:hypothetical protein
MGPNEDETMTTATATIRHLTVEQIAQEIYLSPHPVCTETGPTPAHWLNSDGRTWRLDMLIRLNLPRHASINGAGCSYWIDYETGKEALDARDRARDLISAQQTPESAIEAVRRFYEAE